MSVAKRVPLLGIIAGIALVIVGFINGNTPMIIVGIALIALSFFRHLGKL